METQSDSIVVPEIHTDLPCAICGYNLKGLSPAGNCPECGQPVARSYHFNLAQADPAWLRFQAATVPMLAVLCFLNYGFGLSASVPWMNYAMTLLLVAVNVWACQRLRRPDPADPTDRYGSVRRGLLLASVALLAAVAFNYPRDPETYGWSFSKLPLLAGPILLAVNTFLALFVVAHLCRRTGDKTLHRHARWALWTFSLIEPASLLLPAIAAVVLRDSPPHYAVTSIRVASFFLTLAFTASLLLTLLLLGRVYEVLRFTATTADARAHEQTPRE